MARKITGPNNPGASSISHVSEGQMISAAVAVDTAGAGMGGVPGHRPAGLVRAVVAQDWPADVNPYSREA
jgi:hypothetical protein